MAAKGNKIEISTFQKYGKNEIAGCKTIEKNEKRLLILFGVSVVLSTKKLSLPIQHNSCTNSSGFYLPCSFCQFYLVGTSNFLISAIAHANLFKCAIFCKCGIFLTKRTV